ncbi:DedA family protein [Nocardiopsis sp. HUAS JQ3]|uniref:DedA family protein n=1 Tax=Nocardiopsis sp. HUAS JQ3 TaxID=3061629 RepID=UPI0023A92441|nr:VTT domain-containing protein [Nocardiopsis sp. HUAS JQ3]WDZ91241.1 VTT domain-containing protein [Nocardiopsis sp. HUAS JQ3]
MTTLNSDRSGTGARSGSGTGAGPGSESGTGTGSESATVPGTAHAGEDTPRADGAPLSAEERKAAEREAQKEEARAALRALKPWEGRATRQDKALMAAFVGVPLFFMALTPLKPFLIAHHPVLLEFVTGSNAAVGAAAAFARIGEIPLWLVVVAGVVGKVKIDWLFWWVGRRWGRGFVNLIAPGDRAQRFADRAQDMSPWIMPVAIVLSYLPGIPTVFVLVIAGWTGMRLVPFLLLDALGALVLTASVASVGYAAGQTGVDIVLLVDRYALWFALGIVVVMAFVPVFKQNRAQKRAKAAAEAKAAEEVGAARGDERAQDPRG